MSNLLITDLFLFSFYLHSTLACVLQGQQVLQDMEKGLPLSQRQPPAPLP